MTASEKTAWFITGAVTAIALGGGTAYAATGGTFILGRANSATTTTTLTNSAGTPLSLAAKTGMAPLRVNSGIKVPSLNVDRLDNLDSTNFLRSTGKAADANKLDGLDSTAFALKTGQTGMIQGTDSGDYWFDMNQDGKADSIIATATCPVGTVVTGGGYFNLTTLPIASEGASADEREWFVFMYADPAVNGLNDLEARAICYNPRGAVPGVFGQ